LGQLADNLEADNYGTNVPGHCFLAANKMKNRKSALASAFICVSLFFCMFASSICVTQKDAVESDNDTNPVTREELDDQLTRLNDTSTWHYGERAAGELAGTWTSADGDGHRIVFGADGSFSEAFSGKMTTGRYAISNNGRIVAFSKANGIGLGSHFWLDGKTITGPKGSKPKAKWKRTKTN